MSFSNLFHDLLVKGEISNKYLRLLTYSARDIKNGQTKRKKLKKIQICSFYSTLFTLHECVTYVFYQEYHSSNTKKTRRKVANTTNCILFYLNLLGIEI